MTAGRRVALTGTLTDAGGGLYASHDLVLEAKRYGSSTFTQIATAETGAEGGPATADVTPTKRTAYRWRYQGSESTEGSSSETFRVEVRTAVAARPVSTVVSVSDPVVVRGATTPKKPGYTARLWRTTANGPVRLASATIKRDGTFRLEANPGKTGTWKLYVTVPAGDGNLAGKSGTKRVYVVR